MNGTAWASPPRPVFTCYKVGLGLAKKRPKKKPSPHRWVAQPFTCPWCSNLSTEVKAGPSDVPSQWWFSYTIPKRGQNYRYITQNFFKNIFTGFYFTLILSLPMILPCLRLPWSPRRGVPPHQGRARLASSPRPPRRVTLVAESLGIFFSNSQVGGVKGM